MGGFLHDETWKSEWCKWEWQIAKQANIPVICVVDMHNCIKSEIVSKIQDTESYLLSSQMIEYTHKHRREAMEELKLWLRDLPDRPPDLDKTQLYVQSPSPMDAVVDEPKKPPATA